MSAADFVWALVSGLPAAERERRRIVVLQAAVDDSGNTPQSRAFILAGFVASPTQWAAFTDAWEVALHKAPRVEYFKNNEAMGLKGQFSEERGWTEQGRDNRLVSLAKVIKDHLPERFSVAIRHRDYENYIGGIPVLKRMKNLETPYFMLFYEFMLLTASVHSVGKDVVPSHFVFDQQGKVGTRAREWWPSFRKSMATAAKFDFSPYFTESEPDFKSDREFRPLQAADLYAGQLHRAMLSDIIQIPPSPSLRIMCEISGYHRVLDHKYLYPMRQSFLAMAKRIEDANPGTLNYIVQTADRRKQKREEKRKGNGKRKK